MKNKQLKNLELPDEQLEQASGGSVAHLEYYCADCNVYYSVPTFQCPECGRAPLLAVEHTVWDE